jgi:linoleoyl-CoA desaturase
LLSIAFQVAHCVEEAVFTELPSGASAVLRPWAVHQVEGTVDFARSHRQVEHPLFPKICTIHDPRISKIVQEPCAEFGVRYAVHDGVFAALASHGRWLRCMGNPAAERS